MSLPKQVNWQEPCEATILELWAVKHLQHSGGSLVNFGQIHFSLCSSFSLGGQHSWCSVLEQCGFYNLSREGEWGEWGQARIFEEIMAQNLLPQKKDLKVHLLRTQHTPNRIKKSRPRNIIMKSLKPKGKEFRKEQERSIFMYKGFSIMLRTG